MLVSGCGYAFVAGRGLASVSGGRPVRVGAFQNDSSDADAAVSLARATGRALAARGLAGPGGLSLSGEVEAVASFPVAVSAPVQNQNVQLWRATVRVRFVLSDAAGARVLARATVAESEDYRPGADIEATEAARKLALARAFERCAEDGLDRL